ncbi:glycosyltransferase family 2 protein [Shinella sp. CPCC 101442]|uniref:glycosyltransferase family 2 protein n=1 Tax=Shinella sp. CPCC 101442 TaxID=2932265 RepID=UPI0027E46AA4|nr:glycosyltransferase family 2 protein [Shinella sp. CPCC 101442]
MDTSSKAMNENTLAGLHEGTRLAIVVVTYNSAEVIGGLLNSLPSGLTGLGDTEVVIVDNNSRDTSVEIAASHPVGVRIIQTGRNAGYAAAINAADASIDAEKNLLILNPDIRLEPGCALTLMEQLRDPAIGLAVPQLLHEDGSTAHSLRREPSLITSWSDSLLGTSLAGRLGLGEIVKDEGMYRSGGPVDWASGAALAISARARKAVGKWDETFFLYSEEVDYMERVRRCGLKVAFQPAARAIHIGGEYHGNTGLSALMTSNRIHYYGRHHGAAATFLFRLGIITGEVMRYGLGPGHRAALSAALRPHLEYRAALQR